MEGSEEVSALLEDPEIAALLEKRKQNLLTGGDPAFAKAPPLPKKAPPPDASQPAGTGDAQGAQTAPSWGCWRPKAPPALPKPTLTPRAVAPGVRGPPAACGPGANAADGSPSAWSVKGAPSSAGVWRGPWTAAGGSYGPMGGCAARAVTPRPCPYGGQVPNSGFAMGCNGCCGPAQSNVVAQSKGIALIPKATGVGLGAGAWGSPGMPMCATRPAYLEAKKQMEAQQQAAALAMKRGGPNMTTSAVVMDEEQARKFQESLKRG